MPRKSLEDFNCAWAQAAEAMGDKWSIMIIRDAFFGVKTFSAFEQNIGISKNILALRLEHLQKHGILYKKPVGLGSSRTEYGLTKKGFALFPAIVALGQWSDEWILGEGNAPFVVVDLDKRKPIKQIKVESSDGRELSLKDITFRAGPGANDNTKKIARAIETALNNR